jgi:2,3-bisphosphoglycerate-independent phosphoglycerate mutase
MSKTPAMLVILDGFGWREETADNAVAQANKPNFDRLWAGCPHAFLTTCGHDVGLPDGQMGNSEVGHLNIGAGRVVMQELPRIGKAIKDGSLKENPALIGLVDALKISGGVCHLMGLVSPGGVHAHQDHAVALARLLNDAGIAVIVHVWTDGRDTAPEGAAEFVKKFAAELPAAAAIGTVIGRYYAMDRDKRWERVALAYNLITAAEGARFETAEAAIAASHDEKITDEFIKPAVIGAYAGVQDGDALLCFNFRADRVREILSALLDPGFDGFARPVLPKFAAAIGMTEYSDALAPVMRTLFGPQRMDDLLGEVVARAGKTQLRMAETEKYPHVTYFLNGGREAPYDGEDRIMVPSPKVATYDLQPEMSAPELAEKAVDAINSGKYDMIILNFANPDMVGHTGSLPAAIKAVETVDAGLGKIADAIAARHGTLLVTADHGNCELMRDPETGGPHTAHTLNPVPVLLAGAAANAKLHDGILADLAPTLLALLGLKQPAAMTGHSLLDDHNGAGG